MANGLWGRPQSETSHNSGTSTFTAGYFRDLAPRHIDSDVFRASHLLSAFTAAPPRIGCGLSVPLNDHPGWRSVAKSDLLTATPPFILFFTIPTCISQLLLGCMCVANEHMFHSYQVLNSPMAPHLLRGHLRSQYNLPSLLQLPPSKNVSPRNNYRLLT